MEAGVSTACLYPLYLEQALEELAVRGVKLTEVFVNSDCEIQPAFARDLKKTADAYGMRIASLHPYTCGLEPMMFFTPYERRYTDALEYYKKYFHAMNILGAEVFVFHGNKASNPFPEERYFERFAGLVRLGRSFGITVAQENVSRCVGGKLSFLKSMAEYLKDEAAFVLDAKQAVRAGEDIFACVNTLGSRIVHVHFSDHGKEGDCLPLGCGELNAEKLFFSLKEQGFAGRIILELYRGNYGTYDELAANYTRLAEMVSKY